MRAIPYGRQSISEDDIQAVTDVLRSDWLTQGPAVERFEQGVASYSQAKYGVATNSATSALHLACLALGLREGDWLWTTPITFVASANCGLYCGARIDFVDIDPRTYTLSPQALEAKLEKAKGEGRLPKIVVPVDLCGQPSDMAAIKELSEKYDFKVIEDASHAVGARYRGIPVGSCQYSDITIFSFHPVKIITTGEGGLALTNDSGLADKMALLRSHGITRDDSRMTHPPDGPWYYQQMALGYNYRMSDFQAALGFSQLRKLDAYIRRRKTLAQRYDTLLAALPVTVPWQHPDGDSAWHLYIIRLHLDRIKGTHLQIFQRLRAEGIGVNLHYIPVHLQPFYQQIGFRKGDFQESEAYYGQAITLPLFPGLTEDQQDFIIAALRRAIDS